MRYFPFLLFATLPQTWAQNHFLSPTYNSAGQTGRYAGNAQWPLGSSQLVAFQTTWDDYRIELWQQKVQGGGARLSSNLVYKNRGEDLSQNFRWTVQTYELQLSDSPVFFFWLHDNKSSAQQTSAYFNITIETSSATPTASSTTSHSSTTSVSITSTVPSTSATLTGIPVPGSSSLGGIVTTKGLSTGAAVGIGVAVALGVIIVAIIAGFACFRRRRQRQQQMQQQQQQRHEQQMEWQGFESITFAYSSPKTKITADHDQSRAELPG
ncbi:hypothetical protein F5B18DRAFT_439259 [Nemania serpens]|nr:hypothetical protein F5B18DRAFT_439259 [Nemania serpens]